VEIEDYRISNTVWWQLMVDIKVAVCFRKERNGIVFFAFSFACGKGMSAPRRVRSRPALLQDEQKGEKIRPIVESLDGGR
jgi:hypothetical protein